MNPFYRRIFIYFLILLSLFFISRPLFALEKISSGIALSLSISDSKVENGDIVSLTKNGYILSKIPYDSSIFGVVSKNPAVAFENNDIPNSYPVINFGKVYVRVSTQNGNIKIGDLLTSSKIPGVGMKAIKNGFIIGSALENFENSNPNKTGSILVNLNPQYNSAGAIGISKPPLLKPNIFLRLLIIFSAIFIFFVLGSQYYKRKVKKECHSDPALAGEESRWKQCHSEGTK